MVEKLHITKKTFLLSKSVQNLKYIVITENQIQNFTFVLTVCSHI